MTTLIFLVLGNAMIVALAGHRRAAIALFAIGLVASVLWLNHHMTDHLKLAF